MGQLLQKTLVQPPIPYKILFQVILKLWFLWHFASWCISIWNSITGLVKVMQTVSVAAQMLNIMSTKTLVIIISSTISYSGRV